MEDYEKNCLDMQRYVNYIKEKKVKIQRLLNGISTFYREKIQFDEPRTPKETIRKSKYLYTQNKGI
jgi:hypothetical protein